MKFDSPFVYDDPEWQKEREELLQLRAEKLKKEKKEEKLGRKLNTWGGKRSGAGRPKSAFHEWTSIKVVLTRIQKQYLMELGKGDMDIGIKRFLDQNI